MDNISETSNDIIIGNGTIEWTSYTEYTKDYGLKDFSPKALKAFGDSLLTDTNAASNF